MKFSRYNIECGKSKNLKHELPLLVYIRYLMIPNGDKGIRTLDPLLARQVLSQLSYTPVGSGSHLLSHAVSSIVSSAA